MALGLVFQIGAAFPNMIENLQSMGFFLYLFPFLLSLAIFYGILYYVFWDSDEGKRKLPKSAIAMISIILAFFVMLYASWNVAIVTFLAQLSGAGLIVASGILIAAVFLGLVGFKITDLTNKDVVGGNGRWVFIIGVLLIGILIFFGAGGGAFNLVPAWDSSGQFFTALFVIGIIGLAVWWLGSENNGGAAKE